MPETSARPPFDPQLDQVLQAMSPPPSVMTAQLIPVRRQTPSVTAEDVDAHLAERGLRRCDVTVPGRMGDGITLSVISRAGRTAAGPCIYYAHGGGMVIGSRFNGVSLATGWVSRHDAVLVSVEYRLAPEFPDPYPVEDCYAGLQWVTAHAAELGIDPARILLAGHSAGGGLAAGTALLVRDRGGPSLIGQLLMCPMLDDRDRTVSARQMDGVGVWDRVSNVTGWTALLGDRRGTDDVSVYAAPARATDLSGLPPAYLDCGSAEVFRDEDVAYASGLWEAGVQAELHVWAGGFHGFDDAAPDADVSRAATAARAGWVARVLGG